MMAQPPAVVVIGAGFGGVQVVKGLRRASLRVALVDRHNYHLFQPLLYQVATAALSPADIAYPIRRIFRSQRNVSVGLGEVQRVDLAQKTVHFGVPEELSYDYLVIAAGATHSYFGNDAWRSIAPGLKTIDDATEIRKRVLIAFEEAEYEADAASRKAKLTFVVVGGGPTGVEMAGALREIAAEEIPRDFRNIDTTTARIILVQAGDRLLPAMHPALSARAQRDLEAMGVEVRLNTRATGIDESGLWLGQERLDCQNIIWAAGVEAAGLTRTLGVAVDHSGRVLVEPDLSVPGHPEAFVIGDAASVTDPVTKQPVPGLAPAAMQMGRHVAAIIRSQVAGKRSNPRPAFRYVDKGAMATIGKAHAVADIRGRRFTGLLAWLLWCGLHISFLISFRSKLFVMLGWIYDYLFKSREARLITGPVRMRIRKPRVTHDDAMT